MRMRAQLGTEYTNFLISFTEPWWLDRRLRLDLEAFLTTRYEDSYDQTDTGLAMSVTRAWHTQWRQTFGIRLRQVSLDGFENELYPDTTGTYVAPHPLAAPSDLLLDMMENDEVFANRFVYSMARDTRDRPTMLFPTSGSRIEFGGELITRALGSYSDYYLLTAEGTKYFPVFKQSVLKMRAMVGLADEISGDDIGVFDRFFAGGPGSIRGFDRREVGPVDDEWRENPMGGKTMAIGSVELIRPLSSWAQVSVFTDFGNVWADAFEVSGGINASVGVGLQLQLPVGPVSLAYGLPVMTDQEHLSGNGGKLHFSIGTSF
jgi:outer membrane protein insertion porin family